MSVGSSYAFSIIFPVDPQNIMKILQKKTSSDHTRSGYLTYYQESASCDGSSTHEKWPRGMCSHNISQLEMRGG